MRRSEAEIKIPHLQYLPQTIRDYKNSDNFLVLAQSTQSAYSTALSQFAKHCEAEGVLSVDGITPLYITSWVSSMSINKLFLRQKMIAIGNFIKWAERERQIPYLSESLREALHSK